jgi:hypothetical protein
VEDLMARYRKKPVEVEAVRWDGGNEHEMEAFIACRWWLDDGDIYIGTLEGDMRATEGDWIIRGVQGEFYPCKPDIFEATYEAVT